MVSSTVKGLCHAQWPWKGLSGTFFFCVSTEEPTSPPFLTWTGWWSPRTELARTVRVVFNDTRVAKKNLPNWQVFLETWICQFSRVLCQAFLWIFPKPFVGKFMEVWACLSFGKGLTSLENPEVGFAISFGKFLWIRRSKTWKSKFPKTCQFGKFSQCR